MSRLKELLLLDITQWGKGDGLTLIETLVDVLKAAIAEEVTYEGYIVYPFIVGGRELTSSPPVWLGLEEGWGFDICPPSKAKYILLSPYELLNLRVFGELEPDIEEGFCVEVFVVVMCFGEWVDYDLERNPTHIDTDVLWGLRLPNWLPSPSSLEESCRYLKEVLELNPK